MRELIKNLYKVYDELNKKLFNSELPSIIISVQSQPKTKKCIVYGWCTDKPIWIQIKDGKKTYKYEINMVAEQLNRTYEEIVTTEIHEMCHLHNIVRHIEDCSKRGIHNEKFKEEAERVGLNVEQGDRVGWSITSLGRKLTEIVDKLDVDKEAFNIYRVQEQKPKRTRKVTPQYKYKCPKCNTEIKSKNDILDVLCEKCNVKFIKEEK